MEGAGAAAFLGARLATFFLGASAVAEAAPAAQGRFAVVLVRGIVVLVVPTMHVRMPAYQTRY